MQLASSEAALGWIEDTRTSRMCAFGGILALAVGGPIFILVPELDLVTAGFFFDHRRLSFAGESAAVETLRSGFKLLYIAACLLAIAGTIWVSVGARRATNLDRSKWLFLILCLAVGPGLVSNLALKDQWGRARPKQIVEFGGTKSFTRPLVPARECQRNCSFVSGEASSIFMLFFACSFVFRRRAVQFIVASLLGGAAAGLVRMSQGGHFLSDVFFAGVAMALTAVAIHKIFSIVVVRSASVGLQEFTAA